MTQRITITGPERRRHWTAEEKLAILVALGHLEFERPTATDRASHNCHRTVPCVAI